MSGRYIDENVKRRLYAESMGYCMNPNCRCNLFAGTGDIIEKAHIDPYCNWNGESCISRQAYERAEKMNVKLLTMDAFYEYVQEIK